MQNSVMAPDTDMSLHEHRDFFCFMFSSTEYTTRSGIFPPDRGFCPLSVSGPDGPARHVDILDAFL